MRSLSTSGIQNSSNGNQLGIAGIGGAFDLYQAGFNASWELDVWGKLRRRVESSNARVQVSVEDEHDIRLTLTSDTIATYTEIRVLQKRLQIAYDQVAAQGETERIAKSRLESGVTSKLDVTQARAVAETTRSTIPALQSELRKANNRLCLLLGIPVRVLFDERNIGEIPFAVDSVIVGMPRDLLRRRPDIRRAEREVAAQCALIGVAAAELFPTFALRGTISVQSFNVPELFESASNGGAIVPGVRWDILNYGRLKNNVQVQQNRLEQAVVAYRQTVLKANTEVEDALISFVKKKEQIAAISNAVKAVQESLEVATLQYKEGDVDLDRVNNLRKDLISQLDLKTAAEGQAVIALIRIYKTMGGGWTLPQNCHPMMRPMASASVPPTQDMVTIGYRLPAAATNPYPSSQVAGWGQRMTAAPQSSLVKLFTPLRKFPSVSHRFLVNRQQLSPTLWVILRQIGSLPLPQERTVAHKLPLRTNEISSRFGGRESWLGWMMVRYRCLAAQRNARGTANAIKPLPSLPFARALPFHPLPNLRPTIRRIWLLEFRRYMVR